MFCSGCGSQVGEAKFCPECGSAIATGKAVNAAPKPPNKQTETNHLISNLKQYEEHVELTCLECGYKGLMGVTKRVKNTTARTVFWVVLILAMSVYILFMGGGSTPLLFGAAIGIIGTVVVSKYWPVKTYVHCPNCNKELGPIK